SVISLVSCRAQNRNSVTDQVYYKLISDIIRQDTLVPEWRNKIIEARVKGGQITKEDSIKYYDAIKNGRLLLFERKTNSIAKNALLKDLQENHYLQKYLSLKEIKEVVDRFPAEDEFHDSSKVHKRIELISEFPKWEDYHKFSSPVLI